MFFTFLRAGFFVSLVRSTPHGRPMNNDSAKKSWECGRHVRQKEPAPSAEVRRTRPEVVRAPPDASSYVAGVARARGRARLLRALKMRIRPPGFVRSGTAIICLAPQPLPRGTTYS